jgi:hypothetical protein
MSKGYKNEEKRLAFKKICDMGPPGRIGHQGPIPVFILKDKQERSMNPDYCREVIELVCMTIQILNW